MSLQIQLKKSAVSQKQPFASDLAIGELALNYNADGPFLTCKDTAGNVRKLNHVWVSATAPTSPSAGDLWLDTSATTAVLKVYKDSSATWVNATSIPLATTSVYGTVQLATSADITNGTSGKVVDAAQLQSKVTTEISSALAASPTTIQSLSVTNNAVVGGNLTVNGTTTTINTQDLLVEDKNIIIGNVDAPSDVTADSGGITLKGTTDKTINWVNATDSWTSSENVDLASGKSYRINGTEVLSATALGSAVQISSANIPNGTIVDSDINAAAEIAVSKLADGAARQLLQTDAAGTGVEWTSNVDLPGNFNASGTLTRNGSNVVTVADSGTVTSAMIANGAITDADVNANAAIAGTKIQAGTTGNRGTLQLIDSVASTSTTTAATPSAVKTAYDVAAAALPVSGGTITGPITFEATVVAGGLDAIAAVKAQYEESEIKRNAAFSVGTAGLMPFGVGPAIPPGMAFFGIGADAYNPIHLPSGSFC